MPGKITLITPPDIFENDTLSILFVHLSDKDQDTVSKWLSDRNFEDNLNLYVYNGEPNAMWFLYALSRCEYKYIDLNGMNNITQALSSYSLSKNNVFYKSDDENLVAIYSHINQNRITKIETFLERALGER